MNARQAKQALIKEVEKLTNSKHEYVTAEMLEDGIGVARGENFVVNAGTNKAAWMTDAQAVEEAGIQNFVIKNKRGEVKASFKSIYAIYAKCLILDHDKREYVVEAILA